MGFLTTSGDDRTVTRYQALPGSGYPEALPPLSIVPAEAEPLNMGSPTERKEPLKETSDRVTVRYHPGHSIANINFNNKIS